VILDKDVAILATPYCFEPYVEPSIHILESRAPTVYEIGSNRINGYVVISRCSLTGISIVMKPSNPVDSGTQSE
jgi:hypothetical protein